MITKKLRYLVFFGYVSCIFSQTEEVAIHNVIDNYALGTAYNQSEKVLSAFLPGANMFLDHKDKPLFIMKVEEYANRIDASKAGQFNGRTTNILNIDRFGGIATAKLEVLLPEANLRFIDYLLLKKLNDGWKIISKTAGSENTDKNGEKVLLVVSNVSKQGDSELPAGNSFSEVVVAYDEYKKAGYHVDIVSPKGGKIPLAYINPADSLQLQYLYDTDFIYAISHTQKPEEISPDDYVVLQFTGGSAPIFDIPQNIELQDIAVKIYENNGVIAAVCHGTAGIVNLKTKDGQYLIKNKRVNGVPDSHESKQLPHYAQYPFIIETLLKERGGNFYHSKIGTPHMEVDGRLVTGQNSLSSEMVTRKSIEISKKLIASKLIK